MARVLACVAFATIHAQYCPGAGENFLNLGGKTPLSSNRRCDSGDYANAGSWTYAVAPKKFAAGCTAHYFSHRTIGGNANLVIKIPTPPGTYTVHLFFMEIFHTAANKRKFTLDVNGKKPVGGAGNLDVFAATKGKNKPLQLWTYNVVVTAKSQFVTVTVGRVKGFDNPMISAINVKGAGATKVVGKSGLTSCGAKPPAAAPKPPTTPAKPPVTPIGPGKGGSVTKGSAAVFAGNKIPCPGANDVFINTGGKNLPTGYRCDTGKYGKDKASVMSGSTPGKCTAQLWSHGFSTKTLTYTIPVAPGTYKLGLQFMETYFKAANKRKFTVTVNGKTPQGVTNPLDVYAKAKNAPYVLTMTVATNDFITVKLGKTAFNNPMISAITISGAGANKFVGTEGLKSCGLTGSPPSSGTPGGAKVCKSDFSGVHLAHAVSGGPYVETDFKKQGFAAVFLDGSQSHSHAFEKGNGFINKYSWTWVDKNNPASKGGVVTLTKPKPVGYFPSAPPRSSSRCSTSSTIAPPSRLPSPSTPPPRPARTATTTTTATLRPPSCRCRSALVPAPSRSTP